MADTTITIDASNMTSINFQQAIYDYFAPLGATAGTSTYYSGTYTDGFGYSSGAQVGFRYSGSTNNAQVLIEGANLAYDGIYNQGHGISGTATGFTLGTYDNGTTYTQDDVAGIRSELTGVAAALSISGLDYESAIGEGNVNTSEVYQLYNALRKANSVVDLNGDGTSGYEYVDLIYSLLSQFNQHFIGTAGDDTYVGTVNDDIIEGGAGNDLLTGGDGNDMIDGGAGTDTLTGGLGNDTYHVDTVSQEVGNSDVIVEGTGEGIDTIISTVSHFQISENVENLVIGSTEGLWGYGNALGNTMTGNSGADVLMGLDGDDYISGLGGNDSLNGGNGADTLLGGEGNDTLNGGAGVDNMTGGNGNDIYLVDAAGFDPSATDQIFEDANGGTDLVRSSVSHYQLASNVENLVLTGTSDLWGYGNGLDNTLTGNEGANVLMGLDGNDYLDGATGADSLVGGLGNDTLIGGAGSDTLVGGAGDDTYVVADAGDVVIEGADAGADTVETALGGYILADHVENLVLTGSADIGATGNALANMIVGTNGNNLLSGADGTDKLFGGLGNDTLDGGAGTDTLTGGLGNDTYVVDNTKDKVVELDNQGTDTVKSSVSYTLTDFVERLTLTGSATTGKGNDENNLITGNGAANLLYGYAGNDTLTGGSGADTLYGGLGNDTYVVDNKGDVIKESANQGTDTVRSSVSFTLASNVENLVLVDGSKTSGTGNTLANVLTGSDTSNTLYGLAGNDTIKAGGAADKLYGGSGIDKLYGGDGADQFIFAAGDTGKTTGTADTIYDFIGSKGDRIGLSAIDANTTAKGNQAFDFIGSKAFTGDAGELRYVKTASDTSIYADVNGDKKTDFIIHLDDAITLQASHFIL